MPTSIPVFLLKTRSSPTDAYEDLFASSTSPNGEPFSPSFVPVLEHRFDDTGLAQVRSLLKLRAIGNCQECAYGGLIFTSQRAVEAFALLVAEKKTAGVGGDNGNNPQNEQVSWPDLEDIPVYSVGPATTRALRAIPLNPPLQVIGEHTGAADELAPFIIEDYSKRYADREKKPPLLFLVGEKHRDVIPRVLREQAGWRVDEVVVYGTAELASFREDFAQRLGETVNFPVRWVVVFSPSGCEAMLAALGFLDEKTGRAKPKSNLDEKTTTSTFIATIGKTTKAHLVTKFGYEPEVCAEQPTPKAILEGIMRFMAALPQSSSRT